jgi:sugar/nucleoside kinase (ribokinase family)
MLRVTAPRVGVVDTTGAGDAFNGGFLAALVRGRDLSDCLRLGVHVGSLSTRAAGGIDGLPRGAEMDDLGLGA